MLPDLLNGVTQMLLAQAATQPPLERLRLITCRRQARRVVVEWCCRTFCKSYNLSGIHWATGPCKVPSLEGVVLVLSARDGARSTQAREQADMESVALNTKVNVNSAMQKKRERNGV